MEVRRAEQEVLILPMILMLKRIVEVEGSKKNTAVPLRALDIMSMIQENRTQKSIHIIEVNKVQIIGKNIIS
jgi:hypothetical protein